MIKKKTREEKALEKQIKAEKEKKEMANIEKNIAEHVKELPKNPNCSEGYVLRVLKIKQEELDFLVETKVLAYKEIVRFFKTERIYKLEQVDAFVTLLNFLEGSITKKRAFLFYGRDTFDKTLDKDEAIKFLNIGAASFKNLMLSGVINVMPNPLHLEIFLKEELEDALMLYGISDITNRVKWITQKEASIRFGISAPAVARKVAAGHLKEYSHFDKVYYKAEDVFRKEMPTNMYSVREVCTKLGIVDLLLTPLVFKGRLKEYKDGHRRYYDKAEVDRLYEEDKYWLNNNPDWMSSSQVLEYFKTERTALSGLVAIYKPIKVRNKYWFEKSKIIKDDIL